MAGRSPDPGRRRGGKLDEPGGVRPYAPLVDAEAVGRTVSIFVNVTLEKQIEPVLETFEEHVRARPEVMECYLMTGEFDYLLRVVASDLADYERFLLRHLTRIPGVASIKSSFALKQVAYRTALPIAPETAE